jgi:hypothetical protein
MVASTMVENRAGKLENNSPQMSRFYLENWWNSAYSCS